MGAAAHAALAFAMWFATRARPANGLLLASAALGFAFASFKIAILTIGYALNGKFEFSWTNVEKMLVINIGPPVGLIAIHHLALGIATVRSRFANRYAHAWRERIISLRSMFHVKHPLQSRCFKKEKWMAIN